MYSADSSVDENSPTQFFQIVFLFGRNRQQIRIEHKIPPRLLCFIMADFRLRESVKFFLIMWLCMNIYPYAEIFSLLYITCSVKSTKLSSSLKMSKVPQGKEKFWQIPEPPGTFYTDSYI